MNGRWQKRKNARRGIIVKYAVSIKLMRNFPGKGMPPTSAKAVRVFLL